MLRKTLGLLADKLFTCLLLPVVDLREAEPRDGLFPKATQTRLQFRILTAAVQRQLDQSA